jgi:aerobic-type carbon monoxide dehydrogenase small subunit (CoxS/CutS family)
MELTVNGKTRSVDVEPDALLLHVLREQLDLTGPKYGCGEGQCGACTVLIDGKPRRACITPVKAAAGRQVTTIEGLERNGRLHPLQQAFLDLDVMQCGYCTPGMILTGAALLAANPNPSEQEIMRFMQGNICRCGTYQRIVAAIRKAASAKAG